MKLAFIFCFHHTHPSLTMKREQGEHGWPGKAWYVQREQLINHNGFTHSLTSFQILTIALKIASFSSFALMLFITPLNNSTKAVILTLAFLLLMLVVFLWYKSTAIIPTDSTQLQHLQKIYEAKQHFVLMPKCKICQTYVSCNSQHCKRCGRCVEFYDHHCIWLNNCVGAKNYLQFLGLIAAVVTLFIFIISVSLYVVIQGKHFLEEDKKWVQYLALTISIFNSVLLVPMACLIFAQINIYLKRDMNFSEILKARDETTKTKDNQNPGKERKISQQSQSKLRGIKLAPISLNSYQDHFLRSPQFRKIPILKMKKNSSEINAQN